MCLHPLLHVPPHGRIGKCCNQTASMIASCVLNLGGVVVRVVMLLFAVAVPSCSFSWEMLLVFVLLVVLLSS